MVFAPFAVESMVGTVPPCEGVQLYKLRIDPHFTFAYEVAIDNLILMVPSWLCWKMSRSSSCVEERKSYRGVRGTGHLRREREERETLVNLDKGRPKEFLA